MSYNVHTCFKLQCLLAQCIGDVDHDARLPTALFQSNTKHRCLSLSQSWLAGVAMSSSAAQSSGGKSEPLSSPFSSFVIL